MRLMTAIRTRLAHPSFVDTLFRARCECGWVGPVREDMFDAQDDRSTHWHATAPGGSR